MPKVTDRVELTGECFKDNANIVSIPFYVK